MSDGNRPDEISRWRDLGITGPAKDPSFRETELDERKRWRDLNLDERGRCGAVSSATKRLDSGEARCEVGLSVLRGTPGLSATSLCGSFGPAFRTARRGLWSRLCGLPSAAFGAFCALGRGMPPAQSTVEVLFEALPMLGTGIRQQGYVVTVAQDNPADLMTRICEGE